MYGKLNPVLQVLEDCFTSPSLRFSINWYRPSKKYEYQYRYYRLLFWYRCISMHNKNNYYMYFGFNRCIKDTKRTRGRLDRNVASCSRPTTNVIGPLHGCKKVCPCTKAIATQLRHSRMNQARLEEEEKERKRDRGQEADGKKGSPTKQKPI